MSAEEEIHRGAMRVSCELESYAKECLWCKEIEEAVSKSSG